MTQTLEILRRFENGEKHAHIAKDFGVHQSCVYAIIKRKEKLNKFKDMNGVFGSSVSNIKSLKGWNNILNVEFVVFEK